MSRQKGLERLIAKKERRLQLLKERQALAGIDTPAHILAEIEDIEAEIERLQVKPAELEKSEEEQSSVGQATSSTQRSQKTQLKTLPLVGGVGCVGLLLLIIGVGIVGVIIFFVFLYRTGQPTPTIAKVTRVAASSPPSATFTPEPTNTPIPLTNAPLPASTSTPTFTPILTPTNTAPPTTPLLTALTDLNVRTGPGINYEIVGGLQSGDMVEVIGQNESHEWWKIRFDKAPGGEGWVSGDLEYSTTTNTDNISAVPTPPPPNTPTFTPSPSPTSTDTPVPSTNTPTLVPTSTHTPMPTNTPLPTATLTPMSSPSPTPTPTPFCMDSGMGNTETIQIEPQRTISEIHIDLKKRRVFPNEEQYGFSLWEVEIYGPGTGNLAIGATAIASSSQDNDEHCPRCIPGKAVDGDMNTRWSSGFNEPQWFEIALPDPQVVNHIVLRWEEAYATEYCITVIE